MNWMTGTALYFIIWWLVLFIFLPLGNPRQAADPADVEAGNEGAAPPRPYILLKAIATSITAFVVLMVVVWLIDSPALRAYWA
jgi:predicted secreted protein